MPSFLPHIIVPTLVALALFPIERKRILWLAPIAWAADLDYLIPNQHRAVTTTAFIPLLIFASLIALWRRKDPSARFWEYATRPGHACHLLLSSYFYAAHIFLDVFAGGVVLFWPLLDVNFHYAFEIVLDTGNNTFTPESEGGTSEGAPALAPRYTWLSAVDFALGLFVALVAAWSLIWWKFMRRPVVEVERDATPIHKE